MSSSISTQTKTIEKVSKGQSLGIRLARNESWPGVKIREIVPNSPSATSGLEAGDRIISINGISTENSSPSEAVKILKGLDVGTIAIVIERGCVVDNTMSIINAVLKRTSADEAFGLPLMQSSEPNKVIVGQLKGVSSLSAFKSGDVIVSINGSKVTDVEEGKSLIEQCGTSELNINVYRNKNFKQLVEQEFSKEFFLKWTSSNVCIITRKDNPTPFVECCCCCRKSEVNHTLTLKSGGRVTLIEGIKHNEHERSSQSSGGMGVAASVIGVAASVAMSIVAAASDVEFSNDEYSRSMIKFLHNNALMQKLSRIESQLMVDNNCFELAVFAATTAPQTESMVRVDDNKSTVVDEIDRLKAMLDDGTLNKEEFQQAKTKVLLS